MGTTDALNQVAAGIALIRHSNLLVWDSESMTFSANFERAFEDAAEADHFRYGRVMKWIIFSTGAEYLLKGMMLSKDYLVPTSKNKFDLSKVPFENDEQWVDAIIARLSENRNHSDSELESLAPQYKTMNSLATEWKAFIDDHPESDLQLPIRKLMATYIVLADAIRNRDAHAYVPAVRAAHFSLVNLFAPSFNQVIRFLDQDCYDTIRKLLDDQSFLP